MDTAFYDIVSSAYVWKHVLEEGSDGHGNQKHIDF